MFAFLLDSEEGWTHHFSVAAQLPMGCDHEGRSELCAVLDSLDVAWAGFEHKCLGRSNWMWLHVVISCALKSTL